MRASFFAGALALAVFEVASVYFIMPFPGSQGLSFGLPVAYFLHQARWIIRAVCAGAMLLAARGAFAGRGKWLAAPAALAVAGIAGFFNFVASADAMFKQPATLAYAGADQNALPPDAVVISAARHGEAKAWPIRFLVYHHQVRDTLGGEDVMVTYCSVCRSGRIYTPRVGGKPADFRLVGMDTWNAMFEDAGTGTWWRQATGLAVAGPLKGQRLEALPAVQQSVRDFLATHAGGKVMQPDPASLAEYDSEGRFERGESKGELTRTDRESWRDKSWVVGIEVGGVAKAYDWNRLVAAKFIRDEIAKHQVVITLSSDGAGVYAAADGQPIPAYQEFWHSWRAFHPDTLN